MKKSILILFTVLLTTISCGKNDDRIPNRVPETFNLIGITNGTTGVALMPNFFWTAATDPDGDPVTYDLYLDNNENPTTLFAGDISTNAYKAEKGLSLTSKYYWKVVAKDGKGNTTESKDTYSFTTRNLNFPNTPATANAAFSGRLDHTTAVFDDKLWVIGGSDGFASRKNDVWYSADGSTWTQATANAAFPKRSVHTTVVFDNRLWIIGGFDRLLENGIWIKINKVFGLQLAETLHVLGKMTYSIEKY